MKTILFAISGELGVKTFKSLCQREDVVPIGVLSDSNSSDLLQIDSKTLPLFLGNPRRTLCSSWIEDNKLEFDFLISINYLFIIERDLIDCAKIAAFNLHGSLLPKYRGRTPHVWAIINGESETGVTSHLIDEGCDTGDIIFQKVVPISPRDTGASILKIFESIYPQMVLTSITRLESGIAATPQNDANASYFGKRIPDDGIIDWKKPSLELVNWIRAQANPYPGAFSMYNERKLIVDRAKHHLACSELVDYGPGSFLVKSDRIIVKTGDSYLDLISLRGEIPKSKKPEYFDGFHENIHHR